MPLSKLTSISEAREVKSYGLAEPPYR
jgi:hypothetical protein